MKPLLIMQKYSKYKTEGPEIKHTNNMCEKLSLKLKRHYDLYTDS